MRTEAAVAQPAQRKMFKKPGKRVRILWVVGFVGEEGWRRLRVRGKGGAAAFGNGVIGVTGASCIFCQQLPDQLGFTCELKAVRAQEVGGGRGMRTMQKICWTCRSGWGLKITAPVQSPANEEPATGTCNFVSAA